GTGRRGAPGRRPRWRNPAPDEARARNLPPAAPRPDSRRRTEPAPGPPPDFSSQVLRYERQRHVVAVGDVHVSVVEFLVHVLDPESCQLAGQDSRAPVEMELVAQAAIEEQKTQLLEILPVAPGHPRGIVPEPAPPYVLPDGAGLE